MKGKIGNDYSERARVQKIDAECLKWFLDEQKISVRELSRKPEISVSDQTIRNWIKRGEMPTYLIEEICEALALESICEMRENPRLKCAEPVTTFQYRKAESDGVKLHARIGIELTVSRDLLTQVILNSWGKDGQFNDLEFGDETAEIFVQNGKAAWDHYIPRSWIIEDGIRAGIIERVSDEDEPERYSFVPNQKEEYGGG